MPDPTWPASPVMMPLSSVSDTSSTLPGTWSRSILTTASPDPGSDVLVLRLRLRALHLAEHVLDQRAPVDLVDRVRRDAQAVAQHRHAIAELEDLVEPVRDEDDAPTLRDELARRPEHPLDLRLAERRGRLVEDEQACVADEQAGDLDELPLADREGLDGGPELHVAEAELVEDAPRVLGEAAPPVEERDVEPPEEDVVLDAELGDEAQLLVHERDPVRLRLVRVPERELLAVEADHAFVRPDEADEAFTRVLLPAPLCPQIACTSPTRTSSERLLYRAHRAVRLREADDLEEHRCGRGVGRGANGIRTKLPDPVRRSSLGGDDR